MQENQSNQPITPTENRIVRKPDDKGNIQIDSFVKIFDPNTQEVLVEVRE
jgi:hypothetical protein